MSPTPLPRSSHRVRPWLAAALMMTVWLSSTPARCDPGPGIAQLAASTMAGPMAGPAWQWLQLAWAGLRAWAPGGAREGQVLRPAAARPAAGGWQGAAGAGSAAPDDASTGGSAGEGSSSGNGGAGGADPNG